MKIKIRCEKCRYWEPDSDEPDTAGTCRRYAPRPKMSLDQKEAKRLIYAALPVWPEVTQLEWCGEWRAK